MAQLVKHDAGASEWTLSMGGGVCKDGPDESDSEDSDDSTAHREDDNEGVHPQLRENSRLQAKFGSDGISYREFLQGFGIDGDIPVHCE